MTTLKLASSEKSAQSEDYAYSQKFSILPSPLNKDKTKKLHPLSSGKSGMTRYRQQNSECDLSGVIAIPLLAES